MQVFVVDNSLCSPPLSTGCNLCHIIAAHTMDGGLGGWEQSVAVAGCSTGEATYQLISRPDGIMEFVQVHFMSPSLDCQ